jgi:hypothetical protein
MHQLGFWNTLKTKSPKWVEAKQRSLFSLIAYIFSSFFWFQQLLILFPPLLRSRGGILFDQEGEDIDQDLEGIDFDNLEALANEGRV